MAAVLQLNINRPVDVLDRTKGYTQIASFTIDESTVFNQEFEGDDKITASFVSPVKVDFRVSDFIIYQGDRYKITFDLPPQTSQDDQGNTTYTISFFGPLYDLYDTIIRDEGDETFPYTDTPTGFMALLLGCIRQYDTEWTLGDVAAVADPIQLQFDGTSCRVALTNIAQAFDLEYYVVNKKIYLVESAGEIVDDVTFELGRGKGLYNLSRQGAASGSDVAMATVWFGKGGTTNLPSDYRAKQLTFDGNPVVVQDTYNIYGRREGYVTFQDVFPQRTAPAQSVGKISDNEFYIIDPTIDFDLNTYAIPNSSKIVFKTGELAGNEFIITKFDYPTKKLSYTIIKEDSGYILPNDVVMAAVGDTYTLVNINMPPQYIATAEALLAQKTIAYASEHGDMQFVYALSIDEHYVRQVGYMNRLKAGDRVPVIDSYYSLNADLRIQTLSWPLVNPALISATISEQVQYTLAEKIQKSIVITKSQVIRVGNASQVAKDRASQAYSDAVAAQNIANQAQTDADKANNLLADISNDNLVTPSEKPDVLQDIEVIQGEKPIIDAQADNYGISHADYDSKYLTLITYISPILADMTTNSAIDGPTFRATFKAYYDAKVTLLKAISDKAKQLADDAAQAALYAGQAAAAAALDAQNALAAAAAAQTDADAANQELADIADDNLLTPGEKPTVLQDVQAILGEHPIIDGNADNYGINRAAYDSAYTTLIAYITPLLANMGSTDSISGPQFRANFKAYYDAKIALLVAISNRAKVIADQASAAAQAAQTFATQVQEDLQNSAAYSMFQKTNITDLSVLSAAFYAGNPITGGIAGINGTAFNPTDVVFWSGADFDHKDTASFRVLLNGSVYMSNALIEGTINATIGKIGNYTIDQYGLINTDNTPARIKQQYSYLDGNIVSAYLGTDIIANGSNVDGTYIFDIQNHRNTGVMNAGIRVSVKNGTWHAPLDGKLSGNFAADIEGDVFIKNGNFYFSAGIFYADMVKGMWLYNVMDEFNVNAFHSGQIRAHVTNGKTFLVIHNG